MSEVKCGSVNLTKRVSASLLGAAVALCLTPTNLTAGGIKIQDINLGSAASFAVLAGSGITADPAPGSVINGDLGIYPGAGTDVTGFFTDDGGTGPSIVNGQFQDNDTAAETLAAFNAQGSLTIAMGEAAALPAGPNLMDLANSPATALAPGVYTSATTMTIASGGILYLSGKGVYIFQVGTGLTVGDGASIVLLGGARASDIFWNVGTLASFGSTAAWSGTIMAGTSVTMGDGTTLDGRALAKAAVTLISNTITVPTTGKLPKPPK